MKSVILLLASCETMTILSLWITCYLFLYLSKFTECETILASIPCITSTTYCTYMKVDCRDNNGISN